MQARLELELGDAAELVLEAVAIELEAGPEGSQAEAVREGGTLHVTVTADDVSTLRAALQSCLRAFDTAARVVAD